MEHIPMDESGRRSLMEKLATEMNEPIPAKEVSHNYFEYEESSKCCSEENTKE
jgi:hypothetical protein